MRTCFGILLVVLLGIAVPAAAGVSFTCEAADQGAVTGLGVLSVFHVNVHNTGSVPDTYTVTVARAMPEAWSCSLCQGGVCYPPYVQQITFSVAAGAAAIVDVDVAPLVAEGSGAANLTVTSQGDAAQSQTLTFQVVTAGVQILLVDGDGGSALEDYFTPALQASTADWARWSRHVSGALTAPELAGFVGVIWFGSGMTPALDDADRGALAYYVQHGGSLLLCGQGVARQACDPASPWYSAGAAAWFQFVLGAGWAGPAAGATSVAALPQSPCARTLVAALNGAGGAGNSTAPDALSAAGSGLPAQQYGTGAVAAVAATYGSGRSLLCGYAVESLGPPAARDGFLLAFVNWARGLPTAVDPLPPLAWRREPQAAPNPFNPSTTIRFEVGAKEPVAVEVCDLRGRIVRRLLDGGAAGGAVAVTWDGRGDDGRTMPAGVYVARVVAGRQVRTIKLVLVK
jgi:hypothetical protein